VIELQLFNTTCHWQVGGKFGSRTKSGQIEISKGNTSGLLVLNWTDRPGFHLEFTTKLGLQTVGARLRTRRLWLIGSALW